MFCDLSKNKNPYLPTKREINNLKKNIKLITVYPQKQIEVYEQKLTKELNVNKNQLVLTSGTMEAMNIILNKYKFNTSCVLKPTFWGMEYLSSLNNIKTIEINVDNIFFLGIEDLEKCINKADVIYFCNPNNPTNTYLEKSNLEKLIKNNKDKYFVIDETMLKFDLDFESKSLKKLINKYKNLFIIISFSKIYGVAGLRLGVILTHSRNYDILTVNRGVYLLNSLTGYYLENKDFNDNELNIIRKKIKNNFNYFQSKIKYIYIKSIKNSNSGFILLEVQSGELAKELQQYLYRKKIIVKLMGDIYGDSMKKYIRISAFKFYEALKLIYYVNKFQRKTSKKISKKNNNKK